MSENGNLPDPTGPPEPVSNALDVLGEIGRCVGGLMLAGGVAFTVLTMYPMRTMGAARSAQLKWKARQAEVAKAIQEEQARREKTRSDESDGE